MVARRYARALFNLSEERKQLEPVFADVRNLKTVFDSSKDLRLFLISPVMSKEDRNEVVKSVFEGRTEPLVTTFLYFLILKSRLNILDEILEAFIEIYLGFTNTSSATISVQRAIDPARLRSLVTKLQERTKRAVTANVVIDEKLLGGFKVRIGDQVYDASLSAQLKRYHNDVLSTI